MSAGMVTVQPKRTERTKPSPERCTQIIEGMATEMRQLHKTNALLIATQFAANHECEFDVSDALAAINERVVEHIETLDKLCLEASQ